MSSHSTLLLLPLLFSFRLPPSPTESMFPSNFSRAAGLPPFKVSVFLKICLLGLITSDFYLSCLDLKVSNTVPRRYLPLLATLPQLSPSCSPLSSGAFLVVLYKGPIIWNTSSPSKIPYSLGLSQSNWAIGGIFLAADYLLRSMIFVVQAQIMKVYPAELVVVFLLNLCATIISAPVCLIADMNFSDWKTTTGISLAAILYSGIMGYCFGTIVHTWGVRVKGPVYVALFKPFSIVIAAVTGFIFLGESLYLGSVVGAVVISVGFYVVMWGKAKEEKGEEFAVINSLESPYTPLLGEER
ncbi:WAT1-related protein At5g40230-like isoform X7 [Actinidia eriantha]|uniref:WAT1-related protein At5g40230-like isoform X7 n=1 Tax=Actinidia eriantha TaxID=165200 RepID=UPI002583BB8F|nr:WAT1-related protein At5g40230-like isoform X7 [Actinidia eriantha]